MIMSARYTYYHCTSYFGTGPGDSPPALVVLGLELSKYGILSQFLLCSLMHSSGRVIDRASINMC